MSDPNIQILAQIASNVVEICGADFGATFYLKHAVANKASELVNGALDKRVAADTLLRDLEQVQDRIMFDFELPDDKGDEIRGLMTEIRSIQHEQ